MAKLGPGSDKIRSVVPTIPVPVDSLNLTVTVVQPVIKSPSGKPSQIGSATGFFFEHKNTFYLITNRHVVIDEDDHFYPDHLMLRVHTSNKVLTQNRNVQVPLYDRKGGLRWLEHPTLGSNVDVVAIKIRDFLSSKDVLSAWDETSFFPSAYAIGVGETVVVLGYPLGFYDFVNNLPIARSGTVATPYGVSFDDKPFFLVDSRLDKGTSGSPVITVATPFRVTAQSTFVAGNFPARLLGVNSGEYSKMQIPLGLNAVWYAQLVLDIISGKERSKPITL